MTHALCRCAGNRYRGHELGGLRPESIQADHTAGNPFAEVTMQPEKSAPGEVLLVLVTVPHGQAELIASELVKSGLATCINVVPSVNSFYRWQGKLQQDRESLMLIKCPAASYPALEKRVLAVHPYELPEIISVTITGGLQAYLGWVVNPDSTS